jgi:uncharacterized membrane protein YeaQ/YmgE (transglycosylase-associated protein family)
MQMLWFLLIGLVAGWLAGMISRGGGFGLWGDLATGVVGSFIGGYLFSFMGISTYSTIGVLISSTVGAIILLGVIRLFSRVAPAAQKKE